MRFPKGFSFLFALLFLIVPFNAPAQLDPSFGTGGIYVRHNPATIEGPVSSFLLPDGKIMVVSASRPIATSGNAYKVIRFNSNGTVDTGYGTNGEVLITLPHGDPFDVRAALRQADGKIVIVGTTSPNSYIARLNEDGTLDTSFSSDGVAFIDPDPAGSEVVGHVVMLPDGKLVVAGTFISPQRRLFMMKYETNGTLDATFGSQSGLIIHTFAARDIVGFGRQSTEKLTVLYTPSLFVGGTSRLSRFNADGSLDATFASPDFPAGQAQRLLVTGDDKLIIGGRREFTDNTLRLTVDMLLTRRNADGAADTTYGSAGSRSVDVSGNMDDTQTDITLLPDGSVAAVGYAFIQANRAMGINFFTTAARVGSNGDVLGRHMVVGGAHTNGERVLVQPDGKLVSIGSTPTSDGTTDIRLTRLTGVPLSTYRFRAIPFELTGGPNVQGISHRFVFRPSNNQWWAATSQASFTFGVSGDVPVASDYISTFSSDVAVFRPSNGVWYISGANPIPWGSNGDIPVPYDYEGDGKSDVAVFRPSDGTWYIRHGSDGSYRVNQWGLNGDKPVAGDYDGDGLGDLAVWRPSSGTWYIAQSGDAGYMIVQFGLAGDIPVQEDYDGDLKTDIAVWRPSTGIWYIWRSSDGGFTITPFGLSGDIPVPADYDGDRKTDISVLRSRTWYHLLSSTNSVVTSLYGLAGDIPLAGRQ